jgi:hypothetical protein
MGVEARIMHVNKEKINARLESPGLGYNPVCGFSKDDIEASNYTKVVKFQAHLNTN